MRLDFKAAAAVDRSVTVTRMTATDTDLYLLDSGRGTILRAFMTGNGYQMDPTFQCGPGGYGEQQVGPLIDLAALPGENLHNATVLGMDAAGTLLFCTPQDLLRGDADAGAEPEQIEKPDLHVTPQNRSPKSFMSYSIGNDRGMLGARRETPRNGLPPTSQIE